MGGGCALALLVPLALWQGTDFEAQRKTARTELVRELEDYAGWCQANELFQERSRVFTLLLEFEPDHAEARKILGHVRQKDGSWSVPEKPKAYRDFDKKALAEAPARYRAVCQGYVESMSALLDSGSLSPAEVVQAATEALRFDPDNEHVHALLGDVRGEKGWVLPETVRARARRDELRTLVKEALAQPPAADATLEERERRMPLSFRAVATPRLRVVGSVPPEELLMMAQAGTAIERLCQAVFRSPYAQPAKLTAFLLPDQKQGQTFVENHPAIAPEQRAYYARLEGSGIQGTDDFYFWAGDGQRRTDGTVRLLLGYWLSGAYGITADHGWLYEGFGLLLTRTLVRTRMTWLAQPSTVMRPEELALRQRLLGAEANWLDEAHQMLLRKGQPSLAELFKKNASQLTTEDVLYAYALATYLLEARADALPQLLERTGRGQARDAAFREAVGGADLATFEAHLTRWLGERN